MQITASALHKISSDVQELLGAAWTLDDLGDVDRASHFHGPDGRHFAMKMLHNGSTVQMWITGYPARELPKDADKATEAAHAQYLDQRLNDKALYHTRVHLTRLPDDADLAKVLLDKLDLDLFPAWEHKPRRVGQRPWEEPAQEPTTEAGDTTDAEAGTDVTGNTEAPAAPPEPQPEATPKARRTRKAATPAAASADTGTAAKRTRKSSGSAPSPQAKARTPRKTATTKAATTATAKTPARKRSAKSST